MSRTVNLVSARFTVSAEELRRQMEVEAAPRFLADDDVVARLRALVPPGEPQSVLAKRFGVSTAFVSAVLSGKKKPTGPMLDAIGVERVQVYREKPKESRP